MLVTAMALFLAVHLASVVIDFIDMHWLSYETPPGLCPVIWATSANNTKHCICWNSNPMAHRSHVDKRIPRAYHPLMKMCVCIQDANNLASVSPYRMLRFRHDHLYPPVKDYLSLCVVDQNGTIWATDVLNAINTPHIVFTLRWGLFNHALIFISVCIPCITN